jgi:signal transduction histidine kinase
VRATRIHRHVALACVLLGGLVLTTAAVVSTHAPAHDTLVLLGFAGAGSMASIGLGAILLRSMRRRSVRTQAVTIAGVALLATLSGSLFAAHRMFISSHDLGALFVVLTTSAALALGAAVQLGANLDRSAQEVRELARHLGSSVDAGPPPARRDAPPELNAVAVEVEDLPRRLELLRQRADALEQSRRDLVAWVSHDLRSPLATIRAMAEALDDGVVTEPDVRDRYHHQIRRDAERLSELVDDLFELSRIHSGVLEVRSERVSVRALVDDVLAAARHRAEQKGITLIDEVPHQLVVDVAVAELSRVLHNLVDNAIRHTPWGGRVRVISEAADGSATIAVEDQCGGIPPPDLDRVFDVAFRGDVARGRDEQGGGLGLAIAKGLVEVCEGVIAVDNAADGCRFTVQLPLGE